MRDIVLANHASADGHRTSRACGTTSSNRGRNSLRGPAHRTSSVHATARSHTEACAEGAPAVPRAPPRPRSPHPRISRVGRALWYGPESRVGCAVRPVPPSEVGRGTTLGGGTGGWYKSDAGRTNLIGAPQPPKYRPLSEESGDDLGRSSCCLHLSGQ